MFYLIYLCNFVALIYIRNSQPTSLLIKAEKDILEVQKQIRDVSLTSFEIVGLEAKGCPLPSVDTCNDGQGDDGAIDTVVLRALILILKFCSCQFLSL